MKLITMPRLAVLAVAGASLSLAACNNTADDATEQAADQVEASADATADAMEDAVYLCYLHSHPFFAYPSLSFIQTSFQWLATLSHSLLLQQAVPTPPRGRLTRSVVDKASPVPLPVYLATTVRSRTTGTLSVFLALAQEPRPLLLPRPPWSLWHEPRLLRPRLPPRQPLLLPARPLL